MTKRDRIVLLIIGILCITTISIIYDLREYEELNREIQNKSMNLTHSMYNMSLLSLNLTESLTLPAYYFESVEIHEVLVRRIEVSSNTELVYVYIFPHPGAPFSDGNITPSETFTTYNITLLYPIDYERFRIYLEDLSTEVSSIEVNVEIDYGIDCTFQRPPKHMISGMILSIDMTTWIIIGVTVLALSLTYVSIRLVRE